MAAAWACIGKETMMLFLDWFTDWWLYVINHGISNTDLYNIHMHSVCRRLSFFMVPCDMHCTPEIVSQGFI